MNYLGAADYYFWYGVKTAQIDPQFPINDYPELGLALGGPCSEACTEAYQWGLALGLLITGEDYLELTTEPQDVRMIQSEPDTMRNNMIGNC